MPFVFTEEPAYFILKTMEKRVRFSDTNNTPCPTQIMENEKSIIKQKLTGTAFGITRKMKCRIENNKILKIPLIYCKFMNYKMTVPSKLWDIVTLCNGDVFVVLDLCPGLPNVTSCWKHSDNERLCFMSLPLIDYPRSIAAVGQHEVALTQRYSRKMTFLYVKPSLEVKHTVEARQMYLSITLLKTNHLAGCYVDEDQIMVDIFEDKNCHVSKTFSTGLPKGICYIATSPSDDILISCDSNEDPVIKFPPEIFVSMTTNWENKSYILCLDQDGTIKFKYPKTGQRSIHQPRGLACDCKGNIYISDHGSEIYMLSPDASAVKLLLTERDDVQLPTGVCIDNDNLSTVDFFGYIKEYDVTPFKQPNNTLLNYTNDVVEDQLSASGQEDSLSRSSTEVSSDFSLVVHFLESVDTFIKGDLRTPVIRDLVVLHPGTVLITDYSNWCVKMFKDGGNGLKFRSIFLLDGSMSAGLNGRPLCITKVFENSVAVSIANKKQVLIFTALRNLELTAVVETDKEYLGLAMMSMQYMCASYIQDGHVCVDIFLLSGCVVRSICTKLSADDIPYLTVTPNYQIVLSTTSGPAIIIDGQVMSLNPPEEHKDMKGLRGVTCDKSWNIFIADYTTQTVSVRSPDGPDLQILLTEEEEIHHPLGIYINPDGFLYIGQENGRVQVYEIPNLPDSDYKT